MRLPTIRFSAALENTRSPRVGHLVVLDEVAMAVPDADGIAANADVARSVSELIRFVADDVVVWRVAQVNAKEALVDEICSPPLPLSALTSMPASTLSWEGARVGEMEPANRSAVGEDGEHRRAFAPAASMVTSPLSLDGDGFCG